MATFFNWNMNEPDDFNGNEDCVYINSMGKWNDLRCLTDTFSDTNRTYFMSVVCQL